MSGMVFVSVVEVCADYGDVNVFHVCLNLGVLLLLFCHDQVRC